MDTPYIDYGCVNFLQCMFFQHKSSMYTPGMALKVQVDQLKPSPSFRCGPTSTNFRQYRRTYFRKAFT